LDTDIWEKIKSGEYKGLSFGGATKANRVPKVMKDGEIAYALTDLEHYEVAVCKDPAVPLALITDYNTLAKATIPSVPRGDGKEVIKCDKFGCYVIKSEGKDEPEYYDESIIKGEDFSNADGTTPATVTNTVSQSTQTARPIKTDNEHIDNMSNPAGIIRTEQKIGKATAFYEHISSIPDNGEDYGINLFGINYMYEIK